MSARARAWVVGVLVAIIYVGGFGAGGWFAGIEVGEVTYYGMVGALAVVGLAMLTVGIVAVIVLLIFAALSWIERGH
ncbi:hypothetical protein [Leucobacter triazinivorans]|uniref:Uncharacterized protein n=1 Tax=Leucobacter triazinivorans TaxID=1784719 RepID=A0A4V0Z1K8_9MICO|nr:hypothetical protein [Leucobacter triazinivorans]QBE48759.1 hypothetical protein EVS81_07870 [Leucobacter triazinivorans]